MNHTPYTPKRIGVVLIVLSIAGVIGAYTGYHYSMALLVRAANHEPVIEVSRRSVSSLLAILPAIGCLLYGASIYKVNRLYSRAFNYTLLILCIIILAILDQTWTTKTITAYAAHYGYQECTQRYRCTTSSRPGGAHCLMTFTLPGYCHPSP